MYLVQLLLPVEDSLPPSADSVLEKLKRELASRFGGFTAFTQAPAEGLWAPGSGPEERDRIIVVEVMTDSLDRRWWHALPCVAEPKTPNKLPNWASTNHVANTTDTPRSPNCHVKLRLFLRQAGL